MSSDGLCLSYLVRLDRLSCPVTFADDEGVADGEGEGVPLCVVCEGEGGPPQGFAKIRLQGEGCHKWAEFVNNNGYLRRDKVQERFVELLAQAAARGHTLCNEPYVIDESRLCASPGKVMPDALVAHRVLQTPAAQRLYYGPASCNRSHFPDARDFRIAIVEGGGGGGACVRLRIALLTQRHLFRHVTASLDEDVRVSLALGIEVQGWPQTSDFPHRTTILHPDSLLYHQAATTGFYLVPSAPHPSTRCNDRSSTWQLRFPAAERLLLADSPHSIANRTLATLAAILADLRRTTVSGGRACTSYLLSTLVWFALEQDSRTPLQAMRQWHRSQLSRHVLKCLDQLIAALQTQRQRSYFFPWLNVVLNAADSDSISCATHHFTEEDFAHDAHLLHTYLTRLHAVSLSPRLSHSAQELEGSAHQVGSALMDRWSRLMADMAPSPSTRLSRRRSKVAAESIYSPRQLNYIGQLLRGMLMVKALTLTQTQHLPSWCQSPDSPSPNWDPTGCEDVIYLLSAILDQARAQQKGGSPPKSGPTLRRGTAPPMDAYESAVHCLMQQVRANKCHLPYNDDIILVREVLRWLYLAADFDRKHLAPLVRPFLSRLFTVSHQNCWHIDRWQRNMDAASQEAHALGQFCALVNNKGLAPRDGIVDALRKGWNWAAILVETASRMESGVELILTPKSGTTVRHHITVINYNTSREPMSTRSLGRRVATSDPHTVTLPSVSRQHSLALHESLAARFRQAADGWVGGETTDQWQTPHSYLRANSPMSVVMATSKQYANLRSSYATTIVNALIVLNKFTVLQEIASLLPEDQRSQTLGDIRRVIREQRRSHAQLRATTNTHAQTSFSSQHSAKSTSDRSIVGIDSVSVNQRTQSCLNMIMTSSMNDTDKYATYRSLDELSSSHQTADQHPPEQLAVEEQHSLAGNFMQEEEPNLAGTLLGTCRLARSRQNLPAMCEAAFFEAPIFYCEESVTEFNPGAQPFLALTTDNRLTLLRRSQQCAQRMRDGDAILDQQKRGAKNEMITKL